jgi:hypothetical protein
LIPSVGPTKPVVALGGDPTSYVCLFTVLLPNRNGPHLLHESFSSKRGKQALFEYWGCNEVTRAFMRIIPQEFNLKLERLD